MDLNKSVFSEKEIDFILRQLENAKEKGYLEPRYEKSDYLMASFKGVEKMGITAKWNVKIYTYNMKKNGHSLVCVDSFVLRKLIDEEYDSFVPPDRKLLRIDDAGWGFPLCGVMVGVTDEKKVLTATVPVEYFRHDTKNGFHTKRYLKKYSALGVELLGRFDANPKTHRVEICTGYVNKTLRERLRHDGYDVRVVEIKGLLQNELEQRFGEYVNEMIHSDLYYDPKDMDKSEIPGRYRDALEYGQKHCPHLIKTGWKAICAG